MRSASRSEAPSAAERLDSWKEIAAYLRRDVRTVQRWEKRRGLPIHRLAPGERASVYAFREELDHWWSRNESSLADGFRRSRWAVRTALVLGLALIVSGWLGFRHLAGKAANAPPPATVLVVFENEAHDSDLSGETFQVAVERELNDSGSIQVASRAQVAHCLRRMTLPEATALDRRIGSEIGLRDGNIAALVAGRARRLGTRLAVTVELVSIAQGTVLGSEIREVSDIAELRPALRDLGAWARRELTRILPELPPGPKLERVTTRSLDALQLYTDALILGNRNEWGGAEQLARRALMLDPEFAAAHTWLGWALHNLGHGEYIPSFERALELSSAGTESERFFISGSYHYLTGKLDRAAADYEALLQIEPEHYWAANNLAYIYVNLGMHHKAAALLARLADANHHDLRLQARAAESQLVWIGDREGAEPYLRRARPLLAQEGLSTNPFEASWVEMLPVFLDWRAGRVREALAKTDAVAAKVAYRGTEERKYYARAVGAGYLTLGKLDAAESFFEQLPSREWRYLDLLMVALVRGDDEGLRRRGERYAENFTGWGVPLGGQLLIRAGLLEEAEKVLEYAKQESFQPWKVKLLEAELALARRDASEADLLVLQEVVASLKVSGTATYFLAVEALARAWLANGDLDRAIAALEASSEERHRSYAIAVNTGGFSGSFWLRNRALLAELYRCAGRHQDAEHIADGLRHDLSLADSGLSLADALGSRFEFCKAAMRRPGG